MQTCQSTKREDGCSNENPPNRLDLTPPYEAEFDSVLNLVSPTVSGGLSDVVVVDGLENQGPVD